MNAIKSSITFHIIVFLALLSGVSVMQLGKVQQLQSDQTTSMEHANHQDLALRQQLTILLKSPDFGFRNLVADGVFLSFLQYFGDFDARDILGSNLNPEFFEVIIDRDPYFIASYVFMTNSVSMYAGQPQRSIRLLEKGLSSMAPEAPHQSYFVWRHKATDELLFIGDTQAAKQSYEMAANWAEQSSGGEAADIARLSRQTVAFLETDPNSKPAQISAWSEVLLRATDDNIKQIAIAQIESLGGSILVSEKGQVTVRYWVEPTTPPQDSP